MNFVSPCKVLAGLVVSCALMSCATATRGSHTIFKVETKPEGARVITDLMYKGDRSELEGANEGETIYYGCEATPCGIKLPRRSDFNIMVLKPGFQPATTAVIKERNKMQARKTETTGMAIVGTSTVVGGALLATTAAESGTLAAIFFPPAAAAGSVVVMAMPVAGAATGVDLASGALIDLRPNPLQLDLKPETSAEETEALIAAFLSTRQINSENP